MYMLMLCHAHEYYMRFIITKHEGHRPKGEVIISLILQLNEATNHTVHISNHVM